MDSRVGTITESPDDEPEVSSKWSAQCVSNCVGTRTI